MTRLLAYALAFACVPSAVAQPDVFLITIDTLRADRIHSFGYPAIKTPALDNLAREGVRFTEAFTPSPLTTPSHVSILTGLVPSHHNATTFGARLEAEHPTLARLLKTRGYQTSAFIGAIVLDTRSLAPGLDSGFDFYDNFPEHPASKSRWGRLERRAGDVVNRAEAWIDSHPARRRFVWLHLYDPHDPYEPPAPFSEDYKGRLYDGEIAYTDSALQGFINYLKRRGLYANAIIAVTGDHGEGLGDHGEDTHGVFLYDSTVHVPVIIKLPRGRAAGTIVNAEIRTTDILPTILELANTRAPAPLDGESLAPYFESASVGTRRALSETDYPLDFGWAPLRSLRTKQFKFIEAPHPELYDLQGDPQERHNIYEPWNSWVQEARAELAPFRTARSNVVPPETLAELHALGYLGRADIGSSTNAPSLTILPDPKDKIQEQNLIHRAMIAAESAQIAVAREALSRLLQLNPSSSLALRELGDLDFEDGRYSDAARALRRAVENRPGDPSIAFDLGRALEKMGDLPGAGKALEASLKLSPGQFDARLLLGEIYLKVNDTNSAEDQFEASLLLRPKSTAAKLGLAKAHIALDKKLEALNDLLVLEKADRENPAVFRMLADVYRQIGKYVEAQKAEQRYRALASEKK